MIKSIQKIIKIGSSWGITIPAKELKRHNINFGDEVEVTVSAVHNANESDEKVLSQARDVLSKYKQDFENLARR